MDPIQALILGIIQGLTEYLPVSSSGHLELGEAILGLKDTQDLVFPVLVHAATSLSSMVIFRKEIIWIFRGLLQFKWNDATQYASLILLSMVPVGIIGLFFEKQVEAFFGQQIALVGAMLIVTGLLLLFTLFVKKQEKKVGYLDAILIGIAQAIAVLPGISRSGATISAALLLGIDKNNAARFSFLMVIPPILGKSLLDLKDIVFPDQEALAALSGTPDNLSLFVGFIAAFITGLFACEAMLRIVRGGKLYYFSIYCFIVGIIAIAAGFDWI